MPSDRDDGLDKYLRQGRQRDEVLRHGRSLKGVDLTVDQGKPCPFTPAARARQHFCGLINQLRSLTGGRICHGELIGIEGKRRWAKLHIRNERSDARQRSLDRYLQRFTTLPHMTGLEYHGGAPIKVKGLRKPRRTPGGAEASGDGWLGRPGQLLARHSCLAASKCVGRNRARPRHETRAELFDEPTSACSILSSSARCSRSCGPRPKKRMTMTVVTHEMWLRSRSRRPKAVFMDQGAVVVRRAPPTMSHSTPREERTRDSSLETGQAGRGRSRGPARRRAGPPRWRQADSSGDTDRAVTFSSRSWPEAGTEQATPPLHQPAATAGSFGGLPDQINADAGVRRLCFMWEPSGT